jgi:D-arabinose 5-phosphate isomerase GutQ
MLELGVKVLGNTASAILALREQLNRETLANAIELLAGAARIEFFAVGHYGVVAHDAQFKFLRFGLPCGSHTDVRLQPLAASVLKPQDVVVVISSSGRVDDLLTVVDAARERGAPVLAITASQSPLARKADVALIVDHVEDVATHVPMVSRILHLLVIDILAVGVVMRLGGEAPLPQAAAASLDEARAWAADFVRWYNREHRHSGIRYVTPQQRHDGQDKAILAARHALYLQARQRNPARWSGDTRDWSHIAVVTLNPEHDAVVNSTAGAAHTQQKAA